MIDSNKEITAKKGNIPKWGAFFSASHPSTGGWYTVRYEDSNKGIVSMRPDRSFVPIFKVTDEFKDRSSLSSMMRIICEYT